MHGSKAGSRRPSGRGRRDAERLQALDRRRRQGRRIGVVCRGDEEFVAGGLDRVGEALQEGVAIEAWASIGGRMRQRMVPGYRLNLRRGQ